MDEKFFNHKEYSFFITQVKDGYDIAAEPYKDQKNDHQIQIPPYRELLERSDKSDKIVELGCASGYPVGKDLTSKGFDYTGVDLSQKQIELATETIENGDFIRMDMFHYLSEQPNNSVNAIIILYTLFHLPRNTHIKFFEEVKRVLAPDGLFLLNAPPTSWVGENPDWFGAKMRWSFFSFHFYKLLLNELEFKEIMTYHDEIQFQDDVEETYYLLYQN